MKDSYERLNKSLKLQLSEDLKLLINANVRQVKFEKGSCPVRQGDEISSFYLILQGLVRGFCMDEEGNEVTKCFSCENQFFGTECYRTHKQATYFIECIEVCECLEIPYDFVRKLIKKDAKLENYIVKAYLNEIEKYEGRTMNTLLLSAEKRYLNFLEEYALVEERIPLKYIASYIGVKAGSLSRIRKGLKNISD